MKRLIAILPTLFLSAAFASDAPAPAGAAAHSEVTVHRYLIERTFPPGALDGLDAAAKSKVNANNTKFGVRWGTSYANANKTKTYCIYEGPSKKAVREAAKANAIPVDSVTEVPVTLSPN